MSLDIGKVVLIVGTTEITASKTEDGVKLFLQQEHHMIILTVPEWSEIRRIADKAINFVGEVSA